MHNAQQKHRTEHTVMVLVNQVNRKYNHLVSCLILQILYWNIGRLVENQTQSHSRLNGLTFPCIIYITHVKSRCWKLPSTLWNAEFWGKWNNLEPVFQISYDMFHTISSLCRFPQWKSSVLNGNAYLWMKQVYVTLCFNVTVCMMVVWAASHAGLFHKACHVSNL